MKKSTIFANIIATIIILACVILTVVLLSLDTWIIYAVIGVGVILHFRRKHLKKKRNDSV